MGGFPQLWRTHLSVQNWLRRQDMHSPPLPVSETPGWFKEILSVLTQEAGARLIPLTLRNRAGQCLNRFGRLSSLHLPGPVVLLVMHSGPFAAVRRCR